MAEVEASLDYATSEELIDILLSLINFNHEENWQRILRFVTGLLNTRSIPNLKLASKLIQQILADTPENPNRELISALFSCLPSWTSHFPSDGKALIDGIWPNDESIENQCPIRFKVLQITHNFLQSRQLVVDYQRLYGLIEKLFSSENIIEQNRGKLMMIKLLNIYGFKIQEYDEFNESDFILLTGIINCLRDFYIKLLQEDNVLVQRWTVENLLRITDVTKLQETNLLKIFLEATNRMELHNLEDYSIPDELMRKIGPQNITFLNTFVEINWKDVPIARWLDNVDIEDGDNMDIEDGDNMDIEDGDNMEIEDGARLDQDLLLKICKCISNIKNQRIRQWASSQIMIYEKTINRLSLREFIAFIEALFQKSEDLHPEVVDYLCAKIRECNNFPEEIVNLRSRCIDMIFEKFFDRSDLYTDLLEQLKTVPKNTRGWWRLPPLFILHNERNVLDFYNKEYDIDMQLFKSYADLGKLKEKMECNSDEEKRFVHKRSVDVFVEVNLKKWTDIEELGLDPLELLKSGTIITFLHLTNLLRYHKEKLQNEEVFKAIIDLWKRDSRCRKSPGTFYIFYYAKQNMNQSEIENLFTDIFTSFNDEHEIIEQIVSCGIAIPRDLQVQQLLYGESSTGDARIEAAFEVFLGHSKLQRRDLFISHGECLPKHELGMIIDELLRRNEKIASGGPILERSIEHLSLIRIARCLFRWSSKCYWTDQYWKALLAPNNPLQVSFIYECLIASMLPSVYPLIGKLKTLSDLEPNQQDALVSTAYIYCTLNSESEGKKLKNVVELLESSTLKQAQLVVNRLKAKKLSDDIPSTSESITSPELNLEDKVLGARLLLPDAFENTKLADLILHMTNAPYDEYYNPVWSKIPQTTLEEYRAAFKTMRFP